MRLRIHIHFLLVVLFLVATTATWAQNCPTNEVPQAELISQFVSNLSIKQKRQLDVISKENNGEVTRMKKQLGKVRADIRRVMDDKGDHTNEIMPLLERESALQLQINKALYRIKVKFDEVLTDEQYHELVLKMEKKRLRCRMSLKK